MLLSLRKPCKRSLFTGRFSPQVLNSLIQLLVHNLNIILNRKKQQQQEKPKSCTSQLKRSRQLFCSGNVGDIPVCLRQPMFCHSAQKEPAKIKHETPCGQHQARMRSERSDNIKCVNQGGPVLTTSPPPPPPPTPTQERSEI